MINITEALNKMNLTKYTLKTPKASTKTLIITTINTRKAINKTNKATSNMNSMTLISNNTMNKTNKVTNNMTSMAITMRTNKATINMINNNMMITLINMKTKGKVHLLIYKTTWPSKNNKMSNLLHIM